MAIKGKKKSGSRGSQGARRPAQAPRPVASARRGPTPFYRTTDGKIILGIFLAVAIGVVIWLVMSARNDSKAIEAKARTLDSYTDQLRGVIQNAITPASEMATIPAANSPAVTKKINDSVGRWRTNITLAQSTLSSITPEPNVQKLHQLFATGLVGYLSAADTYETAVKAADSAQDDFLKIAGGERDEASTVLDAAIGILDRLRDDLDLGPSGLQSPLSVVQPQPTALPSSLPSSPSGDGGGKGKGNGGGGNGKGSKGDKKSGGN